jgi:hypothetical protein
MIMELVYNEETQEWQQKPEPFITIEVETEEDFEFIGNAIAFYKKHMNPQTNADRIRAMSDEELAAWMAECDAYRERADANQWLPWLKQPVKENDNG